MFKRLRDNGFTLLEIMVSLAIVGGLLVTLMYSLNYHLGIAQRHEFLTIGTVLARDKIIESEKSPGESTGNFPAPFSDYSYKVGIKDSQYPGIAELSVTVSNGTEKTKLSELVKK
jgi:general secretion pathway protein I